MDDTKHRIKKELSYVLRDIGKVSNKRSFVTDKAIEGFARFATDAQGFGRIDKELWEGAMDDYSRFLRVQTNLKDLEQKKSLLNKLLK